MTFTQPRPQTACEMLDSSHLAAGKLVAKLHFSAHQNGFFLKATATQLSSPKALDQIRRALLTYPIAPEICPDIEIALVEALNNIIEHAYSDRKDDLVEVTVALGDRHIKLTLQDRGRALPEQTVPDCHLPDCNVPLADLPEGGFGWFLIHSLTESITYRREGCVNRLTLRFGTGKSPARQA